MEKQIIKVEGMTCHHCEMTVEKAVKKFGNVKNAKADHLEKKIEIEYDNLLDIAAIKEAIRQVGYQPV
jgi:copper chaperone CopZ